jgi:hypothetical protein
MDFPCKECVHFDQQHKNVNGVQQPAWYGHCARLSVYPHQELEGQTFPPGARRAERGQLGKMVIVEPDVRKPNCNEGVHK